MKACIVDKLHKIAKKEGVQILWAGESGSRGWGFPSKDSDFDVRFIFVRNKADYSTLFAPDLDLQFPMDGDLDVVGWDLKKVLALLLKRNVTPFEWIQSPIVYQQQGNFRSRFAEYISDFFCPQKHVNHYLGIVRSRLVDLQNETIRLKSLFYILRSLLAAEWSLVHRSYAPMVFADLFVLLPSEVHQELHTLLALKSREAESFAYALSDTTRSYILLRFQYLEHEAKNLSRVPLEKQKLEFFFQSIIK